MRKGYKRRKGLIAMAAAFVLVVLLSIPALAVDSSGTTANVYVDGTFVLAADSVLSDYFEINTLYSVSEGTFTVMRPNGTNVGTTFNSVRVVAGSGDYTFNTSALVSGAGGQTVYLSTDASYDDAEFSAFEDRYIVFNHCLMNTGDALYQFIINCSATTSNLVFSSSVLYADGIVDVIVDGFNGIITGLGSGVADFFQTLFLANDGTGNLSTFAIVSLVFIGVAVAFGIARWIIKKVGQ